MYKRDLFKANNYLFAHSERKLFLNKLRKRTHEQVDYKTRPVYTDIYTEMESNNGSSGGRSTS